MAPETKELTYFNLKAASVDEDPDIVCVPKFCWESKVRVSNIY